MGIHGHRRGLGLRRFLSERRGIPLCLTNEDLSKVFETVDPVTFSWAFSGCLEGIYLEDHRDGKESHPPEHLPLNF